MLAPLLALAICPFPQSTSPGVVQLVAQDDGVVAWPGTPPGPDWTVWHLGRPVSDDEGGWIGEAWIQRVEAPFGFAGLLIGQDAGALDQPIKVIRAPGTFAGRTQGTLKRGVRLGGQIAYLEGEFSFGSLSRSVWLEDDLIVEAGDPVAGSSGWTWSTFDELDFGLNGRIIVTGRAIRPSGGTQSNLMVADVTGGTMLLNGIDFFPGVPRRIANVADFNLSPNGEHWSLIGIQQINGERVAIADGEVVDFGGGSLAIQGAPAPPGLLGVFPGIEILDVLSTAIRNDGVPSVLVTVSATFASFATVVMRGARVGQIESTHPRYVGFTQDSTGAIVTLSWRFASIQRPSIRLEDGVNLAEQPSVDVDYDGIPDFGPSQVEVAVDRLGDLNGTGVLPVLGRVSFPGGESKGAIFMTRPTRVDGPVCGGLPNSTGRVGQLTIVGSPVVGDNELTLRLFDLPRGSLGFALFSETSGTPIQPGMSDGVICLGGSIGRFLPGAFVTDTTGNAVVTPDLGALPQPNGAIPAIAGETWYAQVWHRDVSPMGLTSNFSTAGSVTFR